MKLDICKSGSMKNAYLFLPAGSDPKGCVPAPTLAQLGKLSHFKSIDVDAGIPIVAANPKEIIHNIQTKGFHIQFSEVHVGPTEVRTEVSDVGAAIGGGILGASLGFGLAGAIIGAIAGSVLASSAKGDKNDPDA